MANERTTGGVDIIKKKDSSVINANNFDKAKQGGWKYSDTHTKKGVTVDYWGNPIKEQNPDTGAGDDPYKVLGLGSGSGGGAPSFGAPTVAGYTVSAYDPSTNAAYMNAIAALEYAQGNKPNYAGTYEKDVADLYNQIVNRDKFSYDFSKDPTYLQYKDQYTTLGKQAMMDTMGQAAALTGGYGSTYGQAVGQQQYNAYLQKLGEIVPELRNQAFQEYQYEGQDLYNKYGLATGLRDTEYGRYQDSLNNYWNEVNYYTGRADTEYNKGYENYWTTENANMSNYWNKANLDNSNYWNAANLANSNYWNQKNYDLSVAKAATSASKSSSSSKDGISYSNIITSLRNVYDNASDKQGRHTTSGSKAAVVQAAMKQIGNLTNDELDMIQAEFGITDDEWDTYSTYTTSGVYKTR